MSGLNCEVTSPQPPHLTSTSTLAVSRLVAGVLLLFSFSQETAGDQIRLVSSTRGDQILECGDEDVHKDAGLGMSLMGRLDTDCLVDIGSGLILASTGLWLGSLLTGNNFSFLKSKIKEDGESGVLGETSLVLRLRGLCNEGSSLCEGFPVKIFV